MCTNFLFKHNMFSLHNSRAFLLLSFVLFVLTSSINSQLPTDVSYVCTDESNEPSNDTYRSNLDILLESLSDQTVQSNSTFNNKTFGGIYGLYLCRGDVSYTTCQTCVKISGLSITKTCQFNRSAIMIKAECMIRYSDINFFGESLTWPRISLLYVRNSTLLREPNHGASALLYKLIDEASGTDMLFKKGNETLIIGGKNESGYGLVQCTRDINGTGCRNCLNDLMRSIIRCCLTSKKFNSFAPSCNLRFEMHPIIEQAQASSDNGKTCKNLSLFILFLRDVDFYFIWISLLHILAFIKLCN